MANIKMCKHCKQEGHTKFYCPVIPKPALRKNGKVGKGWVNKRRAWINKNPPDHEGYYTCYICGTKVIVAQITLDHVVARSRRPDLRYDHDNLKPCCFECNTRKGSLSIEQYQAKLAQESTL